MTIQNIVATEAKAKLEAEVEAEAAEAWAAFDAALTRPAHTRPELIDKLHHALWALQERGCPEQATLMLQSTVSDLVRGDRS